ncbi:histidine kinase [Paenibacillus sp. GD4]|jgi:two-component system, sensor histidine kinase YesM|uniref:sensor histidine kinase n=1 Tax=Paenibacillus sp. GD4 TaxID=3068890 RepID=UPI002796DC66|nr:histidine kinase [Paenibacillus sp. GD4]MDQ1910139.1 histidine kinase [Paenibacillus sp. GD4]
MVKNSIRNKLILFLLVATILPIATSIWITYFFTKQNITAETIRQNSNLIFQGKTNIINYFNILQQTSLFPYTDEELYRAIENRLGWDYLSTAEVTRGLQRIAGTLREIHQVYLYVASTNKAYLHVQGILLRNEGPEPKIVAPLGNAEVILEPTHASHGYGVKGLYVPPGTAVVTFHRALVNALTMQTLGTLSIDVNLERLKTICEQLYSKGEEELFILDEKGTVIYGPDPELSGKVLQEEWVAHLTGLEEAKGSFEWSKDHFKGIHIYERMETPYMKWTLVKRVPDEVLYRNARKLTQLNSLILLFFLVVVIIATLVISFRFTAPIRDLIRYISQIQTGNMNVDIHVKSQDELGILANRFRLMMQTINNLITEEYRLEIANKTNQLKALQAQINPHFLYNSLQSIGTLALQHNAPKIYSLLSSLAKMMRYSMNTNETMVPLSSELQHVKSYLQLQTQRFENELDVTYEIDPSTVSVTVPKMILQPIVENYFKHGFDPSLGMGRIFIAAQWSEDSTGLRLIIEDNGKGMNEEEAAELQTRLLHPRESEQGESIGLMNVLLRLQLYYTKEAEMRLTRKEPSGLRVELWLPVRPTEEGK